MSTAKGNVPVWLVSTLASAGLVFGGWAANQITMTSSAVAVHEEKINTLESLKSTVEQDHDLLIKIAAKLNVDTSNK